MIKIVIGAVAGLSVFFSQFSAPVEATPDTQMVVTVSGSGGIVPPTQP